MKVEGWGCNCQNWNFEKQSHHVWSQVHMVDRQCSCNQFRWLKHYDWLDIFIYIIYSIFHSLSIYELARDIVQSHISHFIPETRIEDNCCHESPLELNIANLDGMMALEFALRTVGEKKGVLLRHKGTRILKMMPSLVHASHPQRNSFNQDINLHRIGWTKDLLSRSSQPHLRLRK